jgi:hypothetical protein
MLVEKMGAFLVSEGVPGVPERENDPGDATGQLVVDMLYTV